MTWVFLKKRNAMATLEFSLFTVIIIMAFISMQAYFKRALEGNWKRSVDDLSDPLAADKRTMKAGFGGEVGGVTPEPAIVAKKVFAAGVYSISRSGSISNGVTNTTSLVEINYTEEDEGYSLSDDQERIKI